MKRYFLLSLLLHALPVLYFLLLKPITSNVPPPEAHQEQQGQQGKPTEIEVIEQIAGNPEKEKKELKRFYWGIGIGVQYSNYEIPGYIGTVTATKVTEVYNGYTAESAGVLKGDLIFMVNGQLIQGKNDIVGDGPKTLILTISRNGVIVRIQLERCKVYY